LRVQGAEDGGHDPNYAFARSVSPEVFACTTSTLMAGYYLAQAMNASA
jgi:hypothetical protein